MMIFRPGQGLYIPGVQVFQPRAASAAKTWWDNNGAISGCVAAYAPKGAADLASSYINLANPGTYNASPGVAPTFNMANGWTLDGSSQILTTGAIPVPGSWSMLVQFTGWTNPAANFKTPFGTLANSSRWFGVYSLSAGSIRTLIGSGTADNGSDANWITSGNYGIVGNKLFKNGIAQSNVITVGTVNTVTIDIRIGGYATNYAAITICAAAIYNAVLYDAGVSAITPAIAAL